MDAVTAALIGGSIVAFIQGGFTYLNNRKSAPETMQAELKKLEATNDAASTQKLLDFWLAEVEKVEKKQTEQLNGMRQTFEGREKTMGEKYAADLNQIRVEAMAEKTAADMVISSLNSEIRQIVQQRGEDQLKSQSQIHELKESFSEKLLIIEKEKTQFLTGMLDRFEAFCNNIGGQIHDAKSNSYTINPDAGSKA